MDYLPAYQPDKRPNSQRPVPLHHEEQETTAPGHPPAAEEEALSLKEKLVYGLIGLVGLGGATWLTVKLIRKRISNNEEKESFEEGSSATTAKQIRMAFDNDGWPGTDTKLLREVLVAVSSQEDWDKVIKSYERLYSSPGGKANLLRDLSDELQSTEYKEMMQIIGAKPVKKGDAPGVNQYSAWAKRFRAAFEKSYGFLPGTDSESVKVTLMEIPTQRALVQTGVQYKKLYSTNLIKELEAEAEFGQWEEWKTIIAKMKP